MADRTYPFDDPISGRTVILHLGDRQGVEHHGCPDLAEVFPHLDAFYCTTCRWSGKISGVWFTEMVAAHRGVDDG